MSFRDNLIHLRAVNNMTQEQLAMLLGVSRQSVTKWESEKSYPEMDKLLKMCQIFGCTLDDLVQGDLTETITKAVVFNQENHLIPNSKKKPLALALPVSLSVAFVRSLPLSASSSFWAILHWAPLLVFRSFSCFLPSAFIAFRKS